MQLQDSFEYQLAVSELFAKYKDEKVEDVKDIHRGDCPKIQRVYTSLYTKVFVHL